MKSLWSPSLHDNLHDVHQLISDYIWPYFIYNQFREATRPGNEISVWVRNYIEEGGL